MPNSVWVVIVDAAPEARASREMLELVLAGATLEVEMVVVFEGAGCAHLEPEVFAPWRQLVDFELAVVRARQPESELLPSGVSAIDEPELAKLCRRAREVLKL